RHRRRADQARPDGRAAQGFEAARRGAVPFLADGRRARQESEELRRPPPCAAAPAWRNAMKIFTPPTPRRSADGLRFVSAAESQQQQKKGSGDGGDDGGKGAGKGAQKLAKKGEQLKEEMDALIDEIDEVLEENAEEFVKNYVQRGGQ